MSRQLYLNFIKDNRWKYIVNGLGTTLQITFFAVILGIALGFLIAVIRSTYDKTGKGKILNFLAKVYLTVIRGTPVLVQLLIIYFVVFASVDINKIIVAVMAFGINSGAYVAEIIRSGIMSIDDGQFEAGRSLGFKLYTDHDLHYPAAGTEKRASGTGKRVYRTFKRNFRIRIHSHSGSDERRRYHSKPDIQCSVPASYGGSDLSDHGAFL